MQDPTVAKSTRKKCDSEQTSRRSRRTLAHIIDEPGESIMLNDAEAIAMIAVRNIDVAAEFYEGKLGLYRLSTEGSDVITYRSGSSKFNVYRSQFAGTNKATSMLWNVGSEIESIAAQLKSNGVAFEHYDMPGMKLTGDVYSDHHMQVAWFKDPDGNVLSIISS